MAISDEAREQRIREMMEQAGLSRADAEFAVAIELGELPGDVLVEDESSNDAGND